MKKMIILFVLLCSITTVFAQRAGVEVIYGYLYVFPSEIGVFDSKPSRVIEQLNANSQHGYNSWRLPNEEELALLRANGYAKSDETYMTTNRSNSRGIVLLVTTKEDVEYANKKKAEQAFLSSVSRIISQTGFVDLGLSSGTKWAAQNYGGSCHYYTHSQAAANNIPSQAQWQELRRECTWTWVDSEAGFIIYGKNGNAIFLNSTNGFLHTYGEPQYSRRGVGFYWSSSWVDVKNGKDRFWSFEFENGKIGEVAFNKLFEDYRVCVRCVTY